MATGFDICWNGGGGRSGADPTCRRERPKADDDARILFDSCVSARLLKPSLIPNEEISHPNKI